jgi:predicted secreted protein
MPIVSAIVLFMFIWFLTFLAVLPVRLKTQGDVGSITPGTPESAPADPQIKLRLVVTTGIALVLFSIVAYVILSGTLTVEDIDFVNRWVNG